MRTINYIYGTDASEYLPGTNDIDAIFGAGGADTLEGLRQDDTLLGQVGNDLLRGGAGADSLKGGAGRDKLLGGNDADVLDGGSGRDRLDGGHGDDVLTGGRKADQFVFTAPPAGSGQEGFGTDVITDLSLDGPERGGDNDVVIVKGYGGFASIDEFNQFATMLNEDGNDDTGAAAVGEDAVLQFGADGTIVITGGADLFA